MRRQAPRPEAAHVIVGLAFLSSLASTAAAGHGAGITVTPLTPGSSARGLASVVVKLEDDALATYAGGLPGLPATSPRDTGAPLDLTSRASQLYLSHLGVQQEAFAANARKKLSRAEITHRYGVILGGVAMLVPEDEVDQVASLPGVVAVFRDDLLHLATDRSPQFIGLPHAAALASGPTAGGEGVVVGILDTGIWPEHPSFSDPDPLGMAYPVPPGGGLACEFGSAVPGDAPFICNNKLIGARRFMATYEASGPPLLAGEFLSARDDNGHGTHTASTAAGNGQVAASIFGIARGAIAGIAPRAHVVAYKVCGDAGCFESDSAAAVQQAIVDGVDVINFSISGGSDPYDDVVELAFLDAYAAGVFVAASAGNSGPGANTVDHRGPWVTTVAASNTDRAFVNSTHLTASNGDILDVTGASITGGIDVPKAVVMAAGDPFCIGPFAPGTFTDQIVLCRRGGIGRIRKGFNVLAGGAAGMLLYNAINQDQETDNHFLPASHLQADDGAAVLAFLAGHVGVTATMTAGARTTVQGDIIAGFSSRGGAAQMLGVSKPDVTGPGVQILAGHTPLSVSLDTGPQGELFQAIAGTSMSSPHVAGAAALLRALHPDWTPGQVKSALMTTAKTTRVFKEDEITPADAFDYGSGRIDARRAKYPFITFDVPAADYVAHRDDLWNVNYPSVYLPSMPGVMTVRRTAHDVSGTDVTWRLSARAPADVKIAFPASLFVPANGDASFDITISGRDVPLGEVRFATLFLTSKATTLRIPITFVRGEPSITMSQSCDPASFPRSGSTSCTVSFTNTSFSDANVAFFESIPFKLSVVPASVVGASLQNGKEIVFDGSLAAATPPNVSIADGGDCASPACGYLPLSLFGITPVPGMGDESIANFATPPFIYAGETYTSVGLVSNGYLVVGGGTGADVDHINQSFPDADRPNNVLAPFWTDLNPGAGGATRVGLLTDGANSWVVFDWQGVPEFNTHLTNSFQAWIGINGTQDITFAYGDLNGSGDGGLLTVGAENHPGNRGANHYFNGAGSLPTSASELVVSGAAPVAGETHVITFTLNLRMGQMPGPFVLYGQLSSDIFEGTNVVRFAGEVLP
jgi:subtilisin family serine protease